MISPNMSRGEIGVCLNAQWESRVGKMNWLGLENTLRSICRLYANHEISGDEGMMLTDEAIGAFTRRGMEMDLTKKAGE